MIVMTGGDVKEFSVTLIAPGSSEEAGSVQLEASYATWE